MDSRKLVAAGIVFSFLPIWRAAGGEPGMNLWQYFNLAFLRPPGAYPHIPIDEAIVRARQAYAEVKGLSYEEVYDDYIVYTGPASGISSGVG